MNCIGFSVKIFIPLLALSLIGCQSNPDFEALSTELLDIHKKFIAAHLDKNVDFFIQNLSEKYVFVANGEIQHPSAEEMRSRMSSYLNNTNFSEYKDTQKPIVGFSKDGSLGWSIVRVKVAGQRSMDDGTERDLDFICAWITLYEREGDNWKVLGEVSSFK